MSIIRKVLARRFYFILFIGCVALCFCPDYAKAKGELDDHDYFTANADPKMKALLENVEYHHLNRTNEYPGGVMEQIFKGHYNVAFNDLKYTLNRFSNHPKALMLMSLVARLKKEPSLAIPFYERALRLYPGYALTHAQYGRYFLDVGYTKEAISKLETAIRIDPNLAAAHGWLAEAYGKNGQPDLSRKTADRARELGYKGETKTGQ